MNYKKLKHVISLLLSLLFVGYSTAGQVPADLVLKNGYIYTVDDKRSVKEAFAIRGNRIIAVGTVDEVSELIGPATEVRDLGGKFVMPGMHDAHIHTLGIIAPGPEVCDLGVRPRSLEEIYSFVKGCLKDYSLKKGEWLPVIAWNSSTGNEPSERFPNIRAALDAVSVDNPIILWGYEGHTGAANSAALNQAKNPKTGKSLALNAETLEMSYADYREYVGVDSEGKLTGIINETARYLLRTEMLEDMLGGLKDPAKLMPAVAQKLAANGITSIQDARVNEVVLDHYRWLEENGEMTFRVRTALFQQTPGSALTEGVGEIPRYVENFKALRARNQHLKYVKPEAVKLYADGLITGNPALSPPKLPTSAMINGYQQPLFSTYETGEKSEVKIVGYVDINSAQCQSVQEKHEDYSRQEVIDNFQEKFGYHPSQCEKKYGALDHSELFIHEFVRQTTEAGFHVHVHAEADKAIRVTLDAFEQTKALADEKGLTQSMAHVDIASPDDQKRFGQLGVYPVFTYAWAIPNEYMMAFVPFIDHVKGNGDLFNPDHYSIKNLYPVKSIAESGSDIVWGSDTPVGLRDPIPFYSMRQALTRSYDGVVLNEKERIDIHQAIASYTINSAKLFSHDKDLGSIEVGKIADIIVLNQNVVELAEAGEEQEIVRTHVEMTLFDGEIVFERTWFGSVKDYFMDWVFELFIE